MNFPDNASSFEIIKAQVDNSIINTTGDDISSRQVQKSTNVENLTDPEDIGTAPATQETPIIENENEENERETSKPKCPSMLFPHCQQHRLRHRSPRHRRSLKNNRIVFDKQDSHG